MSVGRALHRFRRGHGFKSRCFLVFFQGKKECVELFRRCKDHFLSFMFQLHFVEIVFHCIMFHCINRHLLTKNIGLFLAFVCGHLFVPWREQFFQERSWRWTSGNKLRPGTNIVAVLSQTEGIVVIYPLTTFTQGFAILCLKNLNQAIKVILGVLKSVQTSQF